jgi:hypothetical protein
MRLYSGRTADAALSGPKRRLNSSGRRLLRFSAAAAALMVGVMPAIANAAPQDTVCVENDAQWQVFANYVQSPFKYDCAVGGQQGNYLTVAYARNWFYNAGLNTSTPCTSTSSMVFYAYNGTLYHNGPRVYTTVVGQSSYSSSNQAYTSVYLGRYWGTRPGVYDVYFDALVYGFNC